MPEWRSQSSRSQYGYFNVIATLEALVAAFRTESALAGSYLAVREYLDSAAQRQRGVVVPRGPRRRHDAM